MDRLICIILCVILTVLTPSLSLADTDAIERIDSQPDAAVIPQLASPVPVSFEGDDLEKVLTYFQNTTGYQIEIDWPSLEKWNIPKDTPVTLYLPDVSAARAIELVTVSAAGDRLALLLDADAGLHVTMRREAERLLESDPKRWSAWRTHRQERSEIDGPTPREIAISNMAKVIPWNFDSNRARNVIEYLRNVSHQSIFVDWGSLHTINIHGDSRVSGTGEFRPASEVLDHVLEYLNEDLAWRVDDFGVVIISTHKGLEKLVPVASSPEVETSETQDNDPPAKPGADGG